MTGRPDFEKRPAVQQVPPLPALLDTGNTPASRAIGRERNPSIHGLRGMAASMVFVLHLYGALVTGGLVFSGGTLSRLEGLFALGHRGVELFFLISGYLIVGSLVRHGDATRFLVHRLVRIYPAFVVPHVVIFALGPCVGYAWMADLDLPGWLGHFVTNLLLLPGLFELPLANIVAWTLSLEMAFYLLAATAWLIAKALSPRRKMAGLAGWLTLVAVLLCRQPRAAFFAAGALVWWLERRHRGLPEALGRIPALDVLGLAGLCLLFERAFAASLVCGLAAFMAILSNRGLVCRLLRTRLLQYLGDISYSLYLWHPLVLFGLKRVVAPATGLACGDPTWIALFLGAAIAGSLIVADLSYRWIERRFAWGSLGQVPRASRRVDALQPRASPRHCACVQRTHRKWSAAACHR